MTQCLVRGEILSPTSVISIIAACTPSELYCCTQTSMDPMRIFHDICRVDVADATPDIGAVSYTHLTLPTIYSV